MNKLISCLASLNTAFWSIIGLFLWFVLGVFLAGLPEFSKDLFAMNSLIVLDWIKTGQWDSWLTLAWLTVLLAWAAVLAATLLACLWQRFLNRQAKDLRFWLFCSLHLFFGLIMLFHGLGMLMGQKYPAQTIQPGQTLTLSSDLSLKINKIHFSSDPKLLKLDKHQKWHSMTRDRFDLDNNWAEVSLFYQTQLVEKGKVKMLKPLHYSDFHIVLRGFKYSKQGIVGRLKVVKTPLHKVFTISYLLFILSLTLWFLLQFSTEMGSMPSFRSAIAGRNY